MKRFIDYFPKASAYGEDDPVYQVFLQAYCLHPDPYVARRVILEAVPYLLTTELRRHSQRLEAGSAYHTVYTQQELAQASTLWELLQISIFKVSDAWEKDQEGPRQREPEYQPTVDVMVTRFIKHLTWITMVRADTYPMAVAFGSCLFTYPPRDICALVCLDTAERLHNISRMRKQIERRLTQRFAPPGQNLATEVPDDDQCAVVRDALEVFTPWHTNHLQPIQGLVLNTLTETIPEHQRRHAIMCPQCAGVRTLVEEWNTYHVHQPLPPPTKEQMRVPTFATLPSSGQRDPDPFDPKVDDAFLNDLRISIVDALYASSQRRCAPLFRCVRVCVDGEEQGRCAGAPQTSQLVRIPLDATCVEVFGQDAEGEVPLAVFYLPDLDESATPQPMYHVTESGATFAFTVWPVQDAGGTVTAGQGRIQCWAEEALVPKTAGWYDAALVATLRGLELAQVTGDTTLETALQARLRALRRTVVALAQPEPRDAPARTAASPQAPQDQLVGHPAGPLQARVRTALQQAAASLRETLRGSAARLVLAAPDTQDSRQLWTWHSPDDLLRGTAVREPNGDWTFRFASPALELEAVRLTLGIGTLRRVVVWQRVAPTEVGAKVVVRRHERLAHGTEITFDLLEGASAV